MSTRAKFRYTGFKVHRKAAQKDRMKTTRTNTIYFVRHGENLANITHEFSYKLIDYSLTPKGVLQAEQTADFFKDMSIDAVYSSPLKRAFETAQIIAEPHKLPVTAIEGFREINVGDLELMQPNEATWQLHNQIIAAWIKGKLDTTFPGGENFLELTRRVRNGLLDATRGRSNQRIVVAAHGGCITAIVRSLCPDPNGELTHGSMHNCAITEIELTTSEDRLTSSLRSWACATHLCGEAVELAALKSEKA